MSIEKGTRTRLTTVLILFLVLVTGAVLGIAADRRLEGTVASSESRDSEAERGRADEGGAARQRHLIVEQVGLSEEQKVQVDSIVDEYRQRVRELQDQLQDELREAYTPRYRELLAQTRTEIKGVLSAEQAVAYDSLLAERDRRREERRDSVPGSRPGGRP